MRCAARCGAIVAEMTERSPEEGRGLALEFLEGARRRRAPAVGPGQARQEALALASIRASLGTAAGQR
jgi:glycerol-3-phosphate dehydrogenase